MKPGYSKLLLNEWILSDMGAPVFAAGMDIEMMVLHSGMERTQSQWRKLLGEAGFEVVKFWFVPGGQGEGIIEAVVKE